MGNLERKKLTKTHPTSKINKWQLFAVFKDTFSFVIIFVYNYFHHDREIAVILLVMLIFCFSSHNRHHKLADMSQYDPSPH